MMKIGILGSGRVGQALGKNWLSRGHEVMFSMRDPQGEKAVALLADIGTGAKVGSVRETAVFGDLLLLSIPATALQEVMQEAGNLQGKILLDAVNRIPDMFPNSSIAEDIHHMGSGAQVVKAFNITGSGNMTGQPYGEHPVDIFICGDDAAAKNVVAQLAESSGFGVVDAGPLSNAILLESMARLWVFLAYRQGMGPNIAFKLLKR